MKIFNPTAYGTAILTLIMALPLAAQENDIDDEKGLMQRGFEMLLDGIQQEMAPTLDEMSDLLGEIGPSLQSFLQEMGPALVELADEVSDWSAYELPEILPNGDILIRRKPVPEDAPVPDSELLDGVDI